MNYYIKDSNDFEQIIEDIKNNLSDGWELPEKGIVDDYAYNDYYMFQYKGDKVEGAILYINKNLANNKHIITISPTGKNSTFNSEEHDKVLNHFIEMLKNIDIEFEEQ